MQKKLPKIILICFMLVWSCNGLRKLMYSFGAGSYPCVESWEFDVPEKDVIDAIVAVKKENPQLQPPNNTELFFEREKNEYWLHVNFYYDNSKELVHTWTRPARDSMHTTFALVGFSKMNEKKFRKINCDYVLLTNQIEHYKFKKRILNKIIARIEENKKEKKDQLTPY
jgi:hypothetical protein